MILQDIPQKILSLLRIHPSVGGLEISNSSLKYAQYDGTVWKTASLKLPPGIIEEGIKDKPQFIEALLSLRTQIVGSASNEQINVVLAISSVNIYTQVFTLPVIEGENLEKAIQLNLQMVSPEEISEMYYGWQNIGEDARGVRMEILSSFINKFLVDEYLGVLKEANFIVHSVESKALSLTRLVRELGDGFDKSRPYILFALDNSGLNFLIIRKSQLYFQYFTSWKDLYGEEKQISMELFRTAIIRSLHQVMNFYNSHWDETLNGIFVSASNLREEIDSIINENFSLNILEVSRKLGDISPDWHVAFGSALRGRIPQKSDQEISLMGISARDEFMENQAASFLNLWRLIIPIGLGILMVAFLLSDIFLSNTLKTLKTEPVFNIGANQSKEISDLQQRVKDFNRAVLLIKNAEGGGEFKYKFFDRMDNLLLSNKITLVRLFYQTKETPTTFMGVAASEENIMLFADKLRKDPVFQSVNLPLTEIKEHPQGLLFSMTFSIAFSNL